jgi:hypothetical protein
VRHASNHDTAGSVELVHRALGPRQDGPPDVRRSMAPTWPMSPTRNSAGREGQQPMASVPPQTTATPDRKRISIGGRGEYHVITDRANTDWRARGACRALARGGPRRWGAARLRRNAVITCAVSCSGLDFAVALRAVGLRDALEEAQLQRRRRRFPIWRRRERTSRCGE